MNFFILSQIMRTSKTRGGKNTVQFCYTALANMIELRARIYGRVQMVMFRDFVQRRARLRGLTGFVRNEDDGSVEVAAQGEKSDLERFIPLLQQGPILAKVEDVKIQWREPKEKFDRFEIR